LLDHSPTQSSVCAGDNMKFSMATGSALCFLTTPFLLFYVMGSSGPLNWPNRANPVSFLTSMNNPSSLSPFFAVIHPILSQKTNVASSPRLNSFTRSFFDISVHEIPHHHEGSSPDASY
jgi:hypothetical protein